MSDKRHHNNFKKREQNLTTEQKVEQFIIRNSNNGFFTKVSTISYKFDIPKDTAWSIVGELLASELFDSIHDEYTGEMKLCETGKIYTIKNMEMKRKREKYKSKKIINKESEQNANS
ncbi:hypothetical protein [Nitrosopumilus sp.]|uniref:hypothetical protein n=1 Tax=Nitrosopumilus sp. TaxID=2024843 RepID=UPI00247E9CFC|nr:hypothetical protein [Nitrosopumilus sp.]MCV0430143.1 hypothetical protein [Nitrosopumilus sp.]